jgi:hypothetical protein
MADPSIKVTDYSRVLAPRHRLGESASIKVKPQLQDAKAYYADGLLNYHEEYRLDVYAVE